ncbi:MAG: hypothetical protein NTY81_02525 [Candidatus Staskawiczbacteria bacterium]|nr:hypothetical protein [Candidatus Staskawiczbacteria bacterium]
MKNKIGIFIGVIIFSFFGFFIFCNSADAATIFTDNFNDYINNGSLKGQGSWYASSPNVIVENYTVFEGTKAMKIYEPYPGSFFAEKSGKTLNNGLITIYMRRVVGGTTNPQVEVQLKEGAVVVASMKNNLSFFRYFNGDSASYVNFGPGFSSDSWYALQIQWRSSDHKVRYNINGGAWTSWVSGMANWTTGLNTVRMSVTDGVAYFDAIQENLINVKTKNPVLIVPGLVGTEMKNGDELLWLDIERMLTNIGDNFMDPLGFNQDLTSADNGVYASDVIKKIETAFGLVNYDYTDGLINEFKGQGYAENENLFTFPYDWRYGVSGKFADGKTNADLLATKIQDIMAQTGSDKVDVVAHSMGGLIVKKYAMDNPTDNHIGKAVFVGVPNTGAPKAVKVLLQGDNFGVLGLNDQEIKKISANMPASYDLLPSRQYYSEKGSFIKTINQDIYNLTYSEKDLNYEESESFLTGEHSLNALGLANAENLHTQNFDNYDLRTAGVELYAIDGCRAGTLAQVVERKDKNMFGGEETSYSLQYGALPLVPGDNTVPLESATNLPINQNNKYYALVSDHGKMPSENGIRQEIVNLVSGSNLPTSQDNGQDLITQDVLKCGLNGKAISVFSPVNIFVTDQNGNKLGLADDGSIINEIPNADFEILGEHKFVYLPQDNGQVYNINLQGTGAGTFTIKNQDISNSQIAKTEVFSNLSVTAELEGQINISPADNSTTLSLNNSPEIILPSATLDSSASEDLLPPVSTATLTGAIGQPGFYRSNVNANIKATDDSSGVLDMEYNLDDAGWQKISDDTAVIPVSKEGKHSIIFFSTDKAGNNEQEKTITFTIDKTAPEAVIQFDPGIKDLKFYPAESSDSISDKDDVIILTDHAGNTTEIDLKSKNRKILMSAEIKAIKYNGVSVDISKNQMAFLWLYDKNKNLKMLSQYAKSKKEYNVLAVYDGKNTSLIGKDSSGKILKSLSGLKIIKITTNKGDLSWSY